MRSNLHLRLCKLLFKSFLEIWCCSHDLIDLIRGGIRIFDVFDLDSSFTYIFGFTAPEECPLEFIVVKASFIVLEINSII
jgi:hypothetical protein